MAITRDLGRRKKLPAWFGTKEELTAFFTAVTESIDLPSDERRGWEKATVYETDGTRAEGPILELIDDVHARRIDKLTFSYGPRDRTEWVNIEISRDSGLQLNVSGPERVRVHSLTAAILEEATLTAPPWRFALKRLMYPVYFVVAIGIAFGLNQGLSQHTKQVSSAGQFAIYGAVELVCSAPVIAMNVSTVFPRFEILEPGATPRAYTYFKTVVGFIVVTMIGIVVTFATS